jgi:hypothetical protein
MAGGEAPTGWESLVQELHLLEWKDSNQTGLAAPDQRGDENGAALGGVSPDQRNVSEFGRKEFGRS